MPGGWGGAWSSQVVFANKVVIDGPDDGLFVYNGLPGLGNPPVAWSVGPLVATDPFGNTLPEFAGGFASWNGTEFALLTGGQIVVGYPAQFTPGQLTVSPNYSVILQAPQAASTDNRAQLTMTSNPTGTRPLNQFNGPLVWIDNRGGDGNTYDTGHAVFAASGQLVNSLTPAAMTGITGISVAARQYLIRGTIIIAQGATAGNQAIQITGPAVSSMEISFFCIEGNTVFSSGVATALNTSLGTGAIPIGTTGEFRFDGLITFSAAGSTFGLEALCVTSAADTWNVTAKSYLELIPL